MQTGMEPLTGWGTFIAKTVWLKIWRSLGRQKLVRGLSGVSSVTINRSSTVRLKCPNCAKRSDFSLERLEGNPRCLICREIFDGGPFVQNLNEQLLAAVQRI